MLSADDWGAAGPAGGGGGGGGRLSGNAVTSGDGVFTGIEASDTLSLVSFPSGSPSFLRIADSDITSSLETIWISDLFPDISLLQTDCRSVSFHSFPNDCQRGKLFIRHETGKKRT